VRNISKGGIKETWLLNPYHYQSTTKYGLALSVYPIRAREQFEAKRDDSEEKHKHQVGAE
jgi:hypothetical protein